MPSSIWLTTNQTGTAIDYHLSASTVTKYTGSDTPWTAQGTTPYRIGMNDKTGPRWTPLVSPSGMVFGGGEPFFDGATAIYDQHGNVQETVPIQAYADSHDRAIFLIRQLRVILGAAINHTWPIILAVKPNGATNTSYFEVFSATVQETPDFINEEAGRFVARALITWTRSAFATPASLKNLVTTQTMTNVGTGANANMYTPSVSFGVSQTDGDRLFEGQPLNIKIANTSSSNVYRVWMASVLDRIYTSVSSSKTTTTTIDWGLSGSNVTLNSATYYNTALKGRVLARFTTFTALSKARFQCRVADTGGVVSGTILMRSPRITYSENTSATTAYIDFGWFDLSYLRRTLLGTTAPKISVDFTLSSSDGTSVTATLDYFEVLQYFEFCRVDGGNGASVDANFSMYVEQANNLNQEAYVASRPPLTYLATSTLYPQDPRVVRGTLPRQHANSSFWLAWVDTSYEHTKTKTASVTLEMLPQYASLRGAG